MLPIESFRRNIKAQLGEEQFFLEMGTQSLDYPEAIEYQLLINIAQQHDLDPTTPHLPRDCLPNPLLYVDFAILVKDVEKIIPQLPAKFSLKAFKPFFRLTCSEAEHLLQTAIMQIVFKGKITSNDTYTRFSKNE